MLCTVPQIPGAHLHPGDRASVLGVPCGGPDRGRPQGGVPLLHALHGKRSSALPSFRHLQAQAALCR